MDRSYMDEHRGHRLVHRQSPRGNAYRLPEAFEGLSISECIRRLAAEGWERWEIHQITGIRYQHVRNVLEEAPAGAPAIDGEAEITPSATPPGRSAAAPRQAEHGGMIGDVLQAARREIAALAGVPEEAVKLDLRVELPV